MFLHPQSTCFDYNLQNPISIDILVIYMNIPNGCYFSSFYDKKVIPSSRDVSLNSQKLQDYVFNLSFPANISRYSSLLTILTSSVNTLHSIYIQDNSREISLTFDPYSDNETGCLLNISSLYIPYSIAYSRLSEFLNTIKSIKFSSLESIYIDISAIPQDIQDIVTEFNEQAAISCVFIDSSLIESINNNDYYTLFLSLQNKYISLLKEYNKMSSENNSTINNSKELPSPSSRDLCCNSIPGVMLNINNDSSSYTVTDGINNNTTTTTNTAINDNNNNNVCNSTKPSTTSTFNSSTNHISSHSSSLNTKTKPKSPSFSIPRSLPPSPPLTSPPPPPFIRGSIKKLKSISSQLLKPPSSPIHNTINTLHNTLDLDSNISTNINNINTTIEDIHINNNANSELNDNDHSLDINNNNFVDIDIENNNNNNNNNDNNKNNIIIGTTTNNNNNNNNNTTTTTTNNNNNTPTTPNNNNNNNTASTPTTATNSLLSNLFSSFPFSQEINPFQGLSNNHGNTSDINTSIHSSSITDTQSSLSPSPIPLFKSYNRGNTNSNLSVEQNYLDSNEIVTVDNSSETISKPHENLINVNKKNEFYSIYVKEQDDNNINDNNNNDNSIYQYTYTDGEIIIYTIIEQTIFKSVHTIIFTNLSIGDSGMKELCSSLSRGALPSLKQLYVQNNNIGSEGLSYFIDLYIHTKENKYLGIETLDISSNPLTIKGESQLNDFLVMCSKITVPLRYIYLLHYSIRNVYLNQTINKLRSLSVITDLYISKHLSTNENTIYTSIINTKPYLSISSKSLSETLLHYIYIYILSTDLSSFNTYILHNCSLTDNCVTRLVQTLPLHVINSLTEIDLSRNYLSSISITALFSCCLFPFDSLISINLAGNPIKDEGASLLFEMILNNQFPRLLSLNLSKCLINRKGGQSFLNWFIQSNDTPLSTIDISDNSLGDQVINNYIDIYIKIKSKIKIYVQNNNYYSKTQFRLANYM
ncbi:hypothetical protein WA158_004406 [Blastocystis sp. Blastoise]